ncbi:MAG: hypothetical protein ACRCZF_15720 [Gemmataceae bacterium]
MPAQISGIKTQVILQAEESGTVDRYGVDVLTRVEEIPSSQFPSLLRSKYSVHPRFSAMGVSKINWNLGKHGKFYRATYMYEGFLNGLPEPVYSLSSSLAEEPIELHKDFLTIAGKPSAPLNGAVFIDPDTQKITTDNSKGVFREFLATIDGARNLKAGIESYLSPGAVWTEIYFSTTRPSDLGDLGEIDNPSGPNPSFGSGRNWLYSGADYTRRGGIYEIRKTWILSGRTGWDSDIY